MITENRGRIRREISKFHKVLNHSEVIPAQAFKRNSIAYEFVTHINHIITLFICTNYELIPFQIKRACRSLNSISDMPAYEGYLEIALNYLRNMIFFVSKYTEISEYAREFCIDSISEELGEIPTSPETMHVCRMKDESGHF